MSLRKEKLKAALAVAKEEFSRLVSQYVVTHPTMTYREIGEAIGITASEVAAHCEKHGVSRPRGNGSTAAKKLTNP